ncbi:dipeptide ABC transporter ATP-binding protein [Falsiroseomonas tokyonensis]|uniref:Dipeptide ABC transporter ATP-binding protein n=1 Tax=Falsiroseomonas tokyonensis TaxID=430521 RepID=A0ABV7C3B5_9PROT|nr:ABC transporter ATP-binding protein [Falsiroseomonas tokyonensis]MBU8541135.1 ABC transporter ATP-binding protein [Falsiroseomonas tokyonensis]
MSELLRIDRLRIGAKPDFTAVQDVSFTLAPGEILALVGESGSGKTATARAVIGLLPPGLTVTGGGITFDGAVLTPEKMRPLRGPGIGMVFQEPMTSLNPALPIGLQMSEGLALHTKLRGAGVTKACEAMLARVGIADPAACLRAYPHEFSGGMRQRIMLASVMLLRPKLLIADEPTTALDTLTQAEVLDLMVALTREQGSAVLLITHNLGLVARYADRALVMRRGRIIEQGAARALLAAPQESYTRALVEALPRRGPPPPLRAPSEPLLQAQALTVDFAGRRRFFTRGRAVQAVRGVDLAIHAGEAVALVGGSGSGKTTLGRALLRLVDPSGGRILFRGQDISRLKGAALLPFRMACQIVFQDPYSSLDPRMRVAQIVAEPLRHLPRLGAAERDRRVEAMLDQVGLAGFGARHPHALSGGQRQRVAIARALVRDPDFVMADEPVSALDMTIQKQILTLLRDLQQARRFACLFISHDLAAVGEIADRVVVMQNGLVVEEGDRDAVFDAPRHAYTRALLDAAPRLEALV